MGLEKLFMNETIYAIRKSVISTSNPLILASASPRRKEILQMLEIPFVTKPVDVDESLLPNEVHMFYIDRVLRMKWHEAHRQNEFSDRILLVADTIVEYKDKIFGKPNHSSEAFSMLETLSGKTHQVHTSFGVGHVSKSEPEYVEKVSTSVTFRDLSKKEIENYVRSGECLDKAGSYAIQGRGSFLVSQINGSYFNVVGLPVNELIQSLLNQSYLESFPIQNEK